MRTSFSTTPSDVNVVDIQYENAIRGGDQELATNLAMAQAQSRGYNTFAWHGTHYNFDEFKKGDIGFHFAKDKGVAWNRILDYCWANDDIDFPDGKLFHVAISLHNPIVLKGDLDSWDVRSILQKAALKLLGTPYQSQQSIYLKEQRAVAQDAWRILKSIGIDKETAVKWYVRLVEQQEVDLETLYEETLHKRLIQSRYDGIVYKNDYEVDEEQDPTCYIVFSPNQVKSLDPIYLPNGSLYPLSRRFDTKSPKFTN